ncbi:MAG: hypothetical protein BIFFINMI_03129 [Phycisphaerae bacterium]|nr:hypothetical protein [Phycisphaerae bacterium]
MLRRKLLMILGSLVVLLAVVAALAVWQLQQVLSRLDHITSEAVSLVTEVNEVGAKLTQVEVELYEIQLGQQRHLDRLIDDVEAMRRRVDDMQGHPLLSSGPGADAYGRIRGQIPAFAGQVGSLATTRDPELAQQHNKRALQLSVSLRRDILDLSDVVRRNAETEQNGLAAQFRWLVLGLALVFLLVINISIMLLWRVASIILRPVDELVAASRQLGMEHFDHRVQLKQKDEFGELAGAFNSLGERLAANEQRKIEMLHQVALTLNHELNNAIAIIELQLELLSQQAGISQDGAWPKCLRQIRENLRRMTQTVQALKNIRRVVLTDYTPGEKMIDLEESTRD